MCVCVECDEHKLAEQSNATKPTNQKPCMNQTALVVWSVFDYVLSECVCDKCDEREVAEQSDGAEPTDQKPCTNQTSLVIWSNFDSK